MRPGRDEQGPTHDQPTFGAVPPLPNPADEPGLPGFAPAAAAPAPAAAPAVSSSAKPAAVEQPAYRVLARKYRPQTFDDLIGQDAMVRTLRNAFASGRIPQAWILTGVRGVGKTTTARILARGLNYLLPDGTGGPTVDLHDEGVHCRAIMESRHVDVLEMDAASHTGIEDVRAITDGMRYAPASARYKVYIIDEVHMLSEKAFNAFLKTLEEPPPHAKFVFATTEIRKVPVTILSRCQRFDLRRIDAVAAGAASRPDLRQGRRRGRAGGAGHDRAGGRGLGARFAVAARPGDRPWRGPDRGGNRARHAGPRGPRPHHRPVRGGDARATSRRR